MSPAVRFPGFEGLRLAGAAAVLFSHAFVIASGVELKDPIVRILATAGDYGVYTFFIISGFLLARAFAQDSSAIHFAINRVLRIYPGFVFYVLVTTLVLGPMGSSLDLHTYVTHPDVLGYVKVSMMCVCDQALPGVFAYSGGRDLQSVVNGALWSLSYEVRSYLLLAWLWLALRDMRAVAIVMALLATATSFPPIYNGIVSIAYTLPYFAGGVLMYTIYQYLGLNARLALCCAVLLFVAGVFGLERYAYAIFGAYLVVALGNRPNIGSALAERAGDISYGLYLFGWPIEQLVKQYTQTENPWILMMLAFPLATAISAISCHLVEQPALRLKKAIAMFADRTLKLDTGAQHRIVRFFAISSFLISAAAILISENHWWFVTQSIAEAASVSLASAMLAWIAVTVHQRRRVAVPPEGEKQIVVVPPVEVSAPAQPPTP